MRIDRVEVVRVDMTAGEATDLLDDLQKLLKGWDNTARAYDLRDALEAMLGEIE